MSAVMEAASQESGVESSTLAGSRHVDAEAAGGGEGGGDGTKRSTSATERQRHIRSDNSSDHAGGRKGGRKDERAAPARGGGQEEAKETAAGNDTPSSREPQERKQEMGATDDRDDDTGSANDEDGQGAGHSLEGAYEGNDNDDGGDGAGDDGDEAAVTSGTGLNISPDTEDEEVASLLFSSEDEEEADQQQQQHRQPQAIQAAKGGSSLGEAGRRGSSKTKKALMPDQQTVGDQIRLEKIEENIRTYKKEGEKLNAQRDKTDAALGENRRQLRELQDQVDQLDEAIDRVLDSATTANDALKSEVNALQNQQNCLLSQVADLEESIGELEQKRGSIQSKMDENNEKKAQFEKLKKMALSTRANNDKVDRILHTHRREGSGALLKNARAKRGNNASSTTPPFPSTFFPDAQQANERVRRIMGERLQEVKAKERQQLEHEATQEDHKRQVLLKLKRNIDQVSEEDRRRAIEARKRRQRTEKERRQERERLLAAGQNPEEVFRRRNLDAARAKKQSKAARGREKQEQAIAKKIEQEMAWKRAEVGEKAARFRSTAVGSTVQALHATGGAVQGRFEAEAALQMKQEKEQARKQRQKQREKQRMRQVKAKDAGGVGQQHSHASTKSAGRDAGVEGSLQPSTTAGVGASAGVSKQPSTHHLIANTQLSSHSTPSQKPVVPSASDLAKQLVEGVDVDFGDDSDDDDGAGGVTTDVAGAGSGSGEGMGFTASVAIPALPSDVPASATTETAAAMLAGSQHQGQWDPAAANAQQTVSSSGTAQTRFKSGGKPLSKLEHDRLQQALQRQKDNIVKPQVVAGREFKGPAFVSKPSAVSFRDFDVGEVYTQKIVLTNISYSVNSFQLLPPPTDAISYEYTPSGGLSPGLSTELTVVFAPKTNRDWSGEIRLLAQTGEFTVPVQCTRKRAAVSLSSPHMALPTVYIGERTRAEVQLSNTGALATQYRIQKVADDSKRTQGKEGNGDDDADDADDDGDDDGNTDPTAAAAAASTNTGSSSSGSGNKDDSSGDHDDNNTAAGSSEDSATGAAAASRDDGVSLEADAEGVLQPKSSVTFGVLFAPRRPGQHQQRYRVEFSDRDCPPLELTVEAECTEVPVQVTRNSLDLKICQIGRVFSDHLFVTNNSSTSSFKVAFSVPAPARKYLEVRPRTAVVQGGSRCKVSLVLTPGDDMLRELGEMADSETCLVHIPITMTTEGLAFKTEVVVHANITPGDIEVSTQAIDFGRVAFTESVVVPVTLANTSALPQEFAFTHCPAYIFVQPNSGFGTLLPFETTRVHVICSPQRHPHDDDDKKLRCAIHLEWPGSAQPKKIKCKAVGTLPPLRLSSNRIRFPPTCPGDERVARIELKNVRTATRTFQFGVPKSSTISVSPLCATLKPGERLAVWVRYVKPKRKDSDLFATIRWMLKEREAQRDTADTSTSTPTQQQQSNARGSGRSKASADGTAVSSSGSRRSNATSRRAAKTQRKAGSAAAGHGDGDDGEANEDGRSLNLADVDPDILAAALREVYPPRIHRQLIPCYVKPLPSSSTSSSSSPLASEEAAASAGEQSTFALPHQVNAQLPRPPTPPSRPSTGRASSAALQPGTRRQEVDEDDEDEDEELLVVAPPVAVDKSECSYLDVEVPEVSPVLAVVSEAGRTKHDFGPVLIGEKAHYSVDLLNMSQEVVAVRTSVLDSAGAFATVKAVRPMQPGAVQRVTVAFWPQSERAYYEQFDITCRQQTIKLRLFGQGIKPSLRAIVPDRESHCRLVCAATGQPEPRKPYLVFHDCISGDRVPATLRLENASSLPLTYHLAFASHTADANSQRVPEAHQRHILPSMMPASTKSGVGGLVERPTVAFDAHVGAPTIVRPRRQAWDTCNVSGAPAFFCKGYSGRLEPGQHADVTVTFAPDRASLFYRDVLSITYSSMLPPIHVDVRGRAWTGGPFLIGGARAMLPAADNLLLLTHCGGDGLGGGSEGADKQQDDGAGDGKEGKGSKKSKAQVQAVKKHVPLVYSLAAHTTLAEPQQQEEPARDGAGQGRQLKEESDGAPDVVYESISYTMLAGIPAVGGSPGKRVTGECVAQPLSAEDEAKGFSLSVVNRATIDSCQLLPIVITFHPGPSPKQQQQQQQQRQQESDTGDGEGQPCADVGPRANTDNQQQQQQEEGGAAPEGSSTVQETPQEDARVTTDAATQGGDIEGREQDGGQAAPGDGQRGASDSAQQQDAEEGEGQDGSKGSKQRQLVPGMKLTAATMFCLKAGAHTVQYDVSVQVAVVE